MSCLTPALLAALEAGTLEGAALADALHHVDSCASCKERREELVATARLLAKPVLAEAAPSPESWKAIKERLEAENAKTVVTISCTYCKGGLARAEAVFCAGCLAPHHGDCWEEHGKCASCAHDARVRPEVAAPRRRSRTSFAKLAGASAVAAVLAAGTIAALTYQEDERDRARFLAEQKTAAELARLRADNEREQRQLLLREFDTEQKARQDAEDAVRIAKKDRLAADLEAKKRESLIEKLNDELDELKRSERKGEKDAAMQQKLIDDLKTRIAKLSALPQSPPTAQPQTMVELPDDCKPVDATSNGYAEEPGKVPFDKPPYAVECFDKTKIAVTETKNEKGELSLLVKANCYYPDGTEYYLTARHSKQDAVFARVKTTVKDHKFTAAIGPFKETVPGGELVVDAWFDFVAQPGPIKVLLWPGDAHGSRESENYKKGYFHCPNGCKYDKKNLVIGKVANGGHDAQLADEALEKQKFDDVRQALLVARKSCRAGLSSSGTAEQSLSDLVVETKEAVATFDKWKKTRLFMFFPKVEGCVSELVDAITREGKLYVARASAKDGVAGKFDEMLAEVGKEIEDKSDTIKGFLTERNTVDKQWAELVKQREAEALTQIRVTSGDKKGSPEK